MAGINEGDAIEGIFAIALAELWAYGEIDKRRLNKVRTEIEPEMFNKKRFETIIRDEPKGSNTGFVIGTPSDTFKVKLTVRLKPRSVEGAYGKKYEILFKKSKDIGSLDKKIDALIKNAKTFSSKILAARNRFLKNNKSDFVDIHILADGIEGESSGGAIKGDLMITVKANGKRISSLTYPISLKSGSKTLSNLSPYKGLMSLLDKFDLEYIREGYYAQALGPGGSLEKAKTPEQRKKKVEMLTTMYEEFIYDVADTGGTKDFTKAAFGIFKEAAFGDDLADVVDIQKGGIHTMSVDYINGLEEQALKNKEYLRGTVIGSGSNVKLAIHFGRVGTNKKMHLMTMRKKFRVTGSGGMELKMYVEAGKMAYDPIH